MDELNIAGRRVGIGVPPYIVAEIGSNHNGDMALCRRLVDAAKDAGADAAKFQSWSKTSLIGQAEYERNTKYAKQDPSALTLEQAVEKYQLTPAQHREVVDHCRSRGITFLSSCFSREEVELLETLGAPAYKIASMDVNHLPLLEVVAGTGKPVILSTGMATLAEIEAALGVLSRKRSGPVVLLHCVSTYPCPPQDVNLRNIPMLRATFGVPVGLSDHSLGNAIPLAAVALGACMIEKHFTVDRKLEGWDHAISADPADLAALVRGSREVFEALGRAERVIGDEELEKRKAFRRRMVARRPLKKGDRLRPEDVEFKRPGTGIRPDELSLRRGPRSDPRPRRRRRDRVERSLVTSDSPDVRLADSLLSPSASITEAVARLERAGTGVLLLVEEDDRLWGILTDGDIRRAILGHVPFERPCRDIATRDPIVGPPGITAPEALHLLDHGREFVLDQLPLVTADRRVAGLILRSDLVSRERLGVSAVIMAGGYGKRLLPLTEQVPKPMLPVGDRPLLERTIEHLRDAGIHQVNVTTHYLSEQIRSHFGDGQAFGVDINYVTEDLPLGTAGGLRSCPNGTSLFSSSTATS